MPTPWRHAQRSCRSVVQQTGHALEARGFREERGKASIMRRRAVVGARPRQFRIGQETEVQGGQMPEAR